MNKSNCPCGKPESYKECCETIHRNIANAQTAETLMRSRYTAFTKALGDYLMKSHHSKTRPIFEKEEIVKWTKSVKWNRLEILNTSGGLEMDSSGTVEFKAYYYENRFGKTKLKCIHENSYFEKENGLWMYVGIFDET